MAHKIPETAVNSYRKTPAATTISRASTMQQMFVTFWVLITKHSYKVPIE